MNPIIPNELKDSWLKKENIELEQKRRRRYLHFDEVLEKISPSTFRKVTNPAFVQTYGFFPLIRRVQKVRMYKKDLATKKKIIKTKERPISYAAHFDAAIYSWYAEQLETLFEKRVKEVGLNDNVIAYRPLGKSNRAFAKEVFDFIKTKQESVAIAFDIKGFYDTLDFKILKKAWTNILSCQSLPLDHYQVYKSVTKFSYSDIDEIKKVLGIGAKQYQKLQFFMNVNLPKTLRKAGKIISNPTKGIPQGTPISCVLSNLYMLNFDLAVVKEVGSLGGMYRRYSDDIIVVCSPDKAGHVKKFLQAEIAKVNLIIEDAKTEIRSFRSESNGGLVCSDENGKKSKLQYLGVEFDGKRLRLRHKGYARFERRMTNAIRGEVANTVGTSYAVAKRKLYEKFTPLGKTNYVGYANRAAKDLGSDLIKRPVGASRLFKKVNQKINQEKLRIPTQSPKTK